MVGGGVSVGMGRAVNVEVAGIAGGVSATVREGEAVCPDGFGAQEEVRMRQRRKNVLMFILALYPIAMLSLCFSSHW